VTTFSTAGNWRAAFFAEQVMKESAKPERLMRIAQKKPILYGAGCLF
jgi:hypothetical protein